jgi:hypothetical protein
MVSNTVYAIITKTVTLIYQMLALETVIIYDNGSLSGMKGKGSRLHILLLLSSANGRTELHGPTADSNNLVPYNKFSRTFK